MIHLSKLKIFS